MRVFARVGEPLSESARLTTEWNMLQISGHYLVLALNQITTIETIINGATGRVMENVLDQDDGGLVYALGLLQGVLEDLTLSVSNEKVRAIKIAIDLLRKKGARLDIEVIKGTLLPALQELRSRIQDELEGKVLYHVTPQEVAFIHQAENLFEATARAQFPEVVEDLSEGAICFGFNRYTACVFHLMRAMEGALGAIGTHFKATVINRYGEPLTWGIILGNVKVIVEKLPEGPDKEKWSEVVVLLHYVKIAWRNTTMHPKQTYTKTEAEAIFEAVKAFLRHFAKAITPSTPEQEAS